MKRVYLACGLTHVPREKFASYCAFLHALALNIEELGCTVTYALRDSDPQLAGVSLNERAMKCYEWDRAMVEEADCVVGEISFPSVGLGIELQIAESLGISVVLLHSQVSAAKAEPVSYEGADHLRHDLQLGSKHISLMALGLPNLLEVLEYATPDETEAKRLTAKIVEAIGQAPIGARVFS